MRRHAPNDGDVLTADGVRQAVTIGTRLEGPYVFAVSSGAQRSTQTIACLVAGLGQRLPGGVIVEPGLRSLIEGRWLSAYRRAGRPDLSSLRETDPELVEVDAPMLAQALRRILELLTDGEKALVVGHGATTEAAVFGLTGVEIPPLTHCAGVRIEMDPGGAFALSPL